jgi:predicted nucleic acid-binding protein
VRSQKVILDTGPLIAFLNRNDKYHDWALARLAEVKPPLLSCESVVSEACFLLRHYKNGASNVLKMLERQLIILPFSLEEEIDAVGALVRKYQSVPMSLADACLVRMSEQHSGSVVLTLDRDFKIYRKNKRNVVPTIMPGDL